MCTHIYVLIKKISFDETATELVSDVLINILSKPDGQEKTLKDLKSV